MSKGGGKEEAAERVWRPVGSSGVEGGSPWVLIAGAPETMAVKMGEFITPVARVDYLGLGFQELSLGAGYLSFCLSQEQWQAGLPQRVARFFREKPVRSRVVGVMREELRDEGGQPLPLFTVAKTDSGQGAVVEVNPQLCDCKDLWLSLLLYALALANRPFNRHRFDAAGDFMRLGAFSLVDRHSAEMCRKHLTRRVLLPAEICTHCLKCVTSCGEMRVGVTPQGLRVLGPAEDYCTNCRLCLSHCPELQEVSKEEPLLGGEVAARHFTGGEALWVSGKTAGDLARFLEECLLSGEGLRPWQLKQVFQGEVYAGNGRPGGRWVRQYVLENRSKDSYQPLLITVLGPEAGEEEPVVVLRLWVRAAVYLTTAEGAIEADLISGLEGLGVWYQGVVDREAWGGGGAHPLVPVLNRLGRLAREAPLSELTAAGQFDVVLSAHRQAVPAAVQAYFLQRTGKGSQVLAPQLFESFNFAHEPLLNELRELCLEIFPRYPELLALEVEQARRYLSDIPRYTREIHATYRTWGLGSGHSACPTCAEVSTLAVPLYMAILLSLARGQAPQVTFTCETGCMSETLNKVNEVAQKVKGGRTVFGGGFALGEAAAMSEDWALSRGVLPFGRRYVVSQSGDGGAVIGLPAWLNALRQRAFLIKEREARVLHFINVTDTQVYSNTGGESSASSLLGMSTLTTPLGRWLVGNQRIQWQLINLAAEFPGVLVGQGHSGNKTAMQEFWAEADRLGRSAIRWDVTPCPETGKFFGEDPDQLARVMAQAGFLPEIVFVGRLRKRVAPINPGDRRKNWREWCSKPQPIYTWLSQDPRFRPLIRQDPVSGRWEPINPAVRFIIAQLERYRDDLNRQIDLENRLVREAEEHTAAFFQHLQEEWQKHRHTPEEFPFYFLFNAAGELKPEFGAALLRDFLEAILGQDAQARTRILGEEARDTRLLPPPTHFFSPPLGGQEEKVAGGDSEFSVEKARRARFYGVLGRLVDERAMAKGAQISQYMLKKELSRDFLRQGGVFTHRPLEQSGRARREFRQKLGEVGDFAIGVASLAGERGIAINRVFSHYFTAKGAWAGMAWQFGSSKRGTPVFSGTFVSARPLLRQDTLSGLPFYVLTVTNYGNLKGNPDIFFGHLDPGGYLIVNTPRTPEEIRAELLAAYDETTRRAVAAAESVRQSQTGTEDGYGGVVPGRLREAVSQQLFGASFSLLGDERRRQVEKIVTLTMAKVITTDMEGIMAEVSGGTQAVANLVAVAPIMRALESLGLPVSFEEDLEALAAGFPGAVLKKKKLLEHYLTAMRRAYRECRGFVTREPEVVGNAMADRGTESAALDPGDYYFEMHGTLAGMVMSQLALPEHPLFYIGFPITPAGNPFYAMAQLYANGHPYILVDENNPSEKVAAEKLLGVARVGGALPVTFTASQGWRLFAEIMPQMVGARLEGIFVLCRRALAAPALNIEESHTDFMTFRDDGAIMLSPKNTQEFVSCLYLARLLTHWARLPVVASLGGITDTHKMGLVKVPPDRQVQVWLRRWLGQQDFLEDKLLNRQGEVIVHGPSATNEHYQETQSEVEKAHALALRVFPLAMRAVAELTGYEFQELEVAKSSSGALEQVLVLTGSFYPNAETAIKELQAEGWWGLGAVSVRLFNPFPEEKLVQVLGEASVVTILDRSNSFGSVPPLASRVITGLGRQRSGPPPVYRCLVGGLGGREITVAQIKEIMKFSALMLTPRPNLSEERRRILAEDGLLQALWEEAAALERRNVARHTRVPAMAGEASWMDEGTAKRWDSLVQGDYVKFLANYGAVEFVGAKEVWEESALLKKVVIRLELLLARQLLEAGRGDWRNAVTLLEYGIESRDFDLAVTHLAEAIKKASPETAWQLYRLGESYRSKYQEFGLALSQPTSSAPILPGETPEIVEGGPVEMGAWKWPEVPFSETEAQLLRETLRSLIQESSWQETLRNPEDLEREALAKLAHNPESLLGRRADEDWRQAYQAVYTGVIDRTLWEETLSQHYAPEIKEIFGEEGLAALKLVVQAVLAWHARQEFVERKNPGDLTQVALQEADRYLKEEVYPRYPRSPGIYHDFYRTFVEPELKQFIGREWGRGQ